MATRIALLPLIALTWSALASWSFAQLPKDWTVEVQSEASLGQTHPGVQVTGLAADDLIAAEEALSADEAEPLLRVYVGDQSTPILGRVFVKGEALIFEPRFPIEGVSVLRVELDVDRLRPDQSGSHVQKLRLVRSGEPHRNSTPRLVSVDPEQAELPQNVLRMYLTFDGPMPRGRAYEHVRFLDESGQVIARPYLEIQPELWSPDGTRLTLLFDPGRIKRGLARHEMFGPPFEIGKTYTLQVDANWNSTRDRADARGESKPLEPFEFSFSVVPPDRTQPSVQRWRVKTPKAGDRGPLEVYFNEPLDRGMLRHALTIVSRGGDQAMEGSVTVSRDGKRWTFQPADAWARGEYQLMANPRLEDRAGNSLAQPFERDLTRSPDSGRKAPETTLRFRVREPNDGKPNVVFILADDLGWKDLSCEGSPFYESPNIDRICNEGIRFTHGYAACQVCSPSRAAIMTGKAPARLKITDYIGAPSGTDWTRNTRLLPAFYRRHLPHEDVTMAEAFNEAGYTTFFAGKWHLGSKGSLPGDHGFDINVGGHRRGSPPGGFFVPYQNPQMTDGPPGECLPIRLGAETARFIQDHQDEPFFAYLSFYSVHAPIQTTEELWKKYRNKAEAHREIEYRFIIDRTLPVRQVQDHPLYAGMIESMDDAVGDVLNTLDRLGLSENTIVVFTSDNGGVSSGDGYSTSNLPFRGGKGRQWEGGIREPYYLRWPAKIDAGSQSDTPVTGMDFYPTLLELCDLPARPEQHVDGVSLVPLLEGQPIDERPLFWHYPHYGNQGGEPSSIVRWNDWKLIRYLEDGRTELYGLNRDVGERRDLSEDQPERVARLTEVLDQWLQEVDAEMPTENPNFDADAYAKWKQRIEEQQLPRLERRHAQFLSEDFRPRNGWWAQRHRQEK